MKRELRSEIWHTFVYTCISFTVVSVFFNTLNALIAPGARVDFVPLHLLAICGALSTTQTLCNHSRFMDNRFLLRALLNMAVLFLFAGGVFGWLPLTFWPLFISGTASVLAFVVIWFWQAYQTRRDARDINEAIRRKQTETGKGEPHG